MHDTIKITDINSSDSHASFSDWYASLETFEKDYWVQMAKAVEKTEYSGDLLAKKAIELYCIEMDIDTLPNSEEYLEKLYRRFINNIIYANLVDRGLLKILSGKISFLSEPEIEITAKGKNYIK